MPSLETALLEDLAWLGLEPDVGAAPDVREEPRFVRQSDCATVYEAALSRLTERSRLYGCACSRRSLTGAADAPAGVEIPYPGRYRKAAQDTALRELRAGGASPEAVLGEAAFRAGVTRKLRPVPAAALAGLLD